MAESTYFKWLPSSEENQRIYITSEAAKGSLDSLNTSFSDRQTILAVSVRPYIAACILNNTDLSGDKFRTFLRMQV